MHLRRRQTDATVLDHRVDHVVNQLLEFGRADVRGRQGAGFRAQHWMAHVRDFQNGHVHGNYTGSWRSSPCTLTTSRTRTVSARGAGHARAPPAQAVRAGTARLYSVRVRLLPRPQDRRRHDHPDGRGRHRHGSTGHRSRLRQVGIPGRLCGPRRAPDGGGDPGSTRGVRTRDSPRRSRHIYSYPGRAPVIVVYAATATAGRLCVDDEGLEIAEFTPAAIPWDELAFRSTNEGLRDYLAGLLHPLST